ncbi:hypothetical protein GS429_04930 [Natronorubrum sp. JWXQ-INN-674]|uniref:Uncharacterized protein n=1 Tax=Natronorubrum halalkaliphilum TaxID=2691917 RepID=A0A6B0VJV2_9EURY|nr:hypothetical protein [Natronorubrum halalkaliphilum]MXV61417.1 hypothetical protein [Natronorubrum halalkaliphilum]
MNGYAIPFQALFVVQLLGTLVFAAGLVLGGLTTVTIVGGVLILLSIIGLAAAALEIETEVEAEAETTTTEHADGSRTRRLFGRGSK